MSPHLMEQKGFTLVEVLVVLVLTSLITLALFSSFRAGIQSWKTGERYIERVEGGRQFISLMRRHLLQAKAEQIIDDGGAAFSFDGEAGRIRYVAPLSMSASGEHYLIELETKLRGREGLWARFGLYQTGLSVEEIFEESEYQLLMPDAELQFFYYDKSADEGVWVEQWKARITFPVLVKVLISEPDKEWPAIVMRVGSG